jgi:hypothetical protein
MNNNENRLNHVISAYNSDLSVDFTVRWTDEDNYIIQYIENNTWVRGNSKAL